MLETGIQSQLQELTPQTDPGDAGALNPKGGVFPLVSAGAETRTLAVPDRVGRKIVISMKTDGGDIVLTVASAVNQAGNTIGTFADAGDILVMESVEVGAALAWRVTGNDGVALS